MTTKCSVTDCCHDWWTQTFVRICLMWSESPHYTEHTQYMYVLHVLCCNHQHTLVRVLTSTTSWFNSRDTTGVCPRSELTWRGVLWSYKKQKKQDTQCTNNTCTSYMYMYKTHLIISEVNIKASEIHSLEYTQYTSIPHIHYKIHV